MLVHITKCCQGNYEGDGNGIFYVFIQVTMTNIYLVKRILKQAGTPRTEL